MTATGLAAPPIAKDPANERARRWTFDYRKLVNGWFWLTVASGSVVFVEPAPFDILILAMIALWGFGGFTIHRAILPFVLFLSLWTFGGFVSLIPYWHEEDPVSFMFHTLFISSTGLFFALFLTNQTSRRAELLLTAYTASCVFAATIAVATWLTAFGEGSEWIKDGRAMAPFKDPNVLGSYMVTGALYLIQRLLLGRRRFLWLVLPSLALILAALFLSFSRGSWGAAAVSLTMVVAFLIKTADSQRMRLRVIAGAAGVLFVIFIGLMGALSVDSVRDFFFARAAVEQDYDAGPNGRFGNQLRSIPMLLDLPNGFGPLRFRLVFDLEPHNSYVNAFASNGWLGGFAFIALTFSTLFVGFRQCLTRHPYMRQSQVLFAATFVFFLQGLQIDIDHWRMFYVSLGAVWGIEAARRRWLARQENPQAGSE
ncbi:O-antigen ligase family protein [Rhodoblastus sp.]|jgi:O-antigen ligase|uniref:O-antigen ligase family protein n=1 Tax=Rhodoblastus sp. TaxID=1962975 RepID=UPI00260520EB|nr:O-antigen ligase family protein [Rhodoblastus sp.]